MITISMSNYDGHIELKKLYMAVGQTRKGIWNHIRSFLDLVSQIDLDLSGQVDRGT